MTSRTRLLVLFGCATFLGRQVTAVAPPAPRGWSRVDLSSTQPTLLRGAPEAYEPMLVGQGDDLPQPSAGLSRGGVVLTAPRALALRQLPSTLSWQLTLGAEPYLTFTPLVDASRCRAVATVYAGPRGGPPVQLWTATAATTRWPAGPEVVVDLGRWAGREIGLHLDVRRAKNGYPDCAMVWGSLALLSRAARQTAGREPKGPPNVLLIGVDTLRADALGAWGRRPTVTPALDALAAESDVFLDAFSTSNSTNPSFSSIHTGLYVQHHGVRDLQTPLPAAHVTLAERFTTAGFDTHAVLSAQHLNNVASGLGQGFASVDESIEHAAARFAVDRAIEWLQRPRRKPFFVWVHLFDPHTPHMPPAPFALGQRAAAPYGLSPVESWVGFRSGGLPPFRVPGLAADRDLYFGEVAYVDREIDRLLGLLRSRGELADTVVAFVADHGENLEEHGLAYRHAGLWDTTTHVPLMIRWPDRLARGADGRGVAAAPGRGRRLHGLVQTIDLYPTLLAAAGLRPGASDGRDLRAMLEGGRRGRPAVFAEQADGKGASVRTTAWRYFASAGSRLVTDGPYLYDLARDPGELTNLTGRGRREEADLRATLASWQRDGKPAAPRSKLTPEEEARLRALGYQ
jgi:arylsulfatase A-like enzyme